MHYGPGCERRILKRRGREQTNAVSELKDDRQVLNARSCYCKTITQKIGFITKVFWVRFFFSTKAEDLNRILVFCTWKWRTNSDLQFIMLTVALFSCMFIIKEKRQSEARKSVLSQEEDRNSKKCYYIKLEMCFSFLGSFKFVKWEEYEWGLIFG